VRADDVREPYILPFWGLLAWRELAISGKGRWLALL
jgi:hypothetical protein